MFSAAMDEAAAAARSGAAAAYPALPPVPSDGPTVVVGDRQLYDALSQRLARGGAMQELPPRCVGRAHGLRPWRPGALLSQH